MQANKIRKMALFTDIHWGAKANSEMHNKDCLDFIDWFCSNVELDDEIDAIGFLGDWNENRSALNIATLHYSYKGAKKLNNLNIPIYFIVGNHDLYYRHSRDIHSVVVFNELTNFVLIDEPTTIPNEGLDDILFCPFMFHEEYPQLSKFINVPVWMGHFEFKGFEVTGTGIKMPTGPNPDDFKGPKFILSGHFHKRQAQPGNNVVYIGNTFPTNFSDAGDSNRGMAIYDFENENITFKDWEDCPMYYKVKLSDLLDGTVSLQTNSRVNCVCDIPISFEESTYLRQKFKDEYELREFVLEESPSIQAAMSGEKKEIEWSEGDEMASTDELVNQMLAGIETEHINNDMLISIYTSLSGESE